MPWLAALSTLSLAPHADAQTSADQITVTNLTSAGQNEGTANGQTGQRFSPPVFVTHSADDSLYNLGQTAAQSVWRIAEGGDRSHLINEVTALVGSSGLGEEQ